MVNRLRQSIAFSFKNFVIDSFPLMSRYCLMCIYVMRDVHCAGA